MQACWPKLEAVIKSGNFMGANEEFHEFRKAVDAETDLDAHESHAALAWEFLVGYAVNKSQMRKLILQTVHKLKSNASFSKAFEGSSELRANASSLHPELSEAFFADKVFVKYGREMDVKAPEVSNVLAEDLQHLRIEEPPKIAVVGKRGVGKSTLVNSLMGLRPRDPGAAPTGADEVVTDQQRQDGHVWNHNGVIFKDIPGCEGSEVNVMMGTDYIEKYKLDTADAVLLIYTDVLEPRMLEFLTMLESKRVATFLVRNKVGSCCREEVEDGNHSSLDRAFEALKENVHGQIDKAGEQFQKFKSPDKLFLIEAKFKDSVAVTPKEKFQHDFHRLKEALGSSIFDEAKQVQIANVLGRNAEGLAQNRADLCYEMSTLWVAAAAAGGAIPVPGVGEFSVLALASAATRSFLKAFCIDACALSHEEDPEMKSFREGLVTAILLRVGTSFAVGTTVSLASDTLFFIPIVGCAIVAVIGSATGGRMMYSYLNELIPRLQKISARLYEINFQRNLDEHAAKTQRKERMMEIMSILENYFPKPPEKLEALENEEG